jgi:hypothetical protein
MEKAYIYLHGIDDPWLERRIRFKVGDQVREEAFSKIDELDEGTSGATEDVSMIAQLVEEEAMEVDVGAVDGADVGVATESDVGAAVEADVGAVTGAEAGAAMGAEAGAAMGAVAEADAGAAAGAEAGAAVGAAAEAAMGAAATATATVKVKVTRKGDRKMEAAAPIATEEGSASGSKRVRASTPGETTTGTSSPSEYHRALECKPSILSNFYLCTNGLSVSNPQQP